ncbi:MAG: L,D-transpeptidase [Thermomicrobiales bacterium]|nr:L,D-transpeptidase [Thermomicrobiales bacterium]
MALAQDWSPPRTVWVEESGHTVDGFFLDEWRDNPDLLGNPITEEAERPVLIPGLPADNRIVQYFENIAIAYVPEAESRELMVRALPLGEDSLQRDRKKFSHIDLPDKAGCETVSSTCHEFEESGFSVAGDFYAFWVDHDGERLIGEAITGAFKTPDGYITQYFTNAVLHQKEGEEVEARPIGKETTTFLRLATAAIPQPASIPLYDETLFVEPAPVIVAQTIQQADNGLGGVVGSNAYSGPGPQQGASKEIVVSISQQSLWAYEGGQLVVSTLVSTGTAEVPQTVTPIGYFSVHLKYVTQTMSGTISDEAYEVKDVPWVMYFDYQGNAIHGTYWHNNFGTPMSHGCVNLPLDIAEFLYQWAPEGTAVTVIA